MSFSILSILLFVHSKRLHAGDSQVKWKESNRFFNFKFRCIDDVLSLNKVDDFVDYIYAIELEIKYFKDRAESTSCLALHLDIDSEVNNECYDKEDVFNIYIVSFLFIYLYMLQH